MLGGFWLGTFCASVWGGKKSPCGWGLWCLRGSWGGNFPHLVLFFNLGWVFVGGNRRGVQ